MFGVYNTALKLASPLLKKHLNKRVNMGKEHDARLGERMGHTNIPRPNGKLIWFHAASVGEAQSALILIKTLLKTYENMHILITTGTITSAKLIERNTHSEHNLYTRLIHQFAPLDHPNWVDKFISHWQPNMAVWVESELWPNMVLALKKHSIPSALINARLSKTSFKKWSWVKKNAAELLNSFNTIICQSNEDVERFKALGAHHINTDIIDNLKYAAAPLPVDKYALASFNAHLMNRPVWLYASTHQGEEDIACRVHQILKHNIPDILTIIAPRHPKRRDDIKTTCASYKLNTVLRSESGANLPQHDTDIYIADTMGELGLFYRISPITMIGHTMSDDGGGGHNPIEAAQLGCAILHGNNIQFQEQLFDEFREHKASIAIRDEARLAEQLLRLLQSPQELQSYQNNARNFIKTKSDVADKIIKALHPTLIHATIADA